MNFKDRLVKRLVDIFFSATGLILLWPLILIVWLAATIDSKSNGFFIQERVGQYGKYFRVIKIRTMRPALDIQTTVTKRGDPRITKLGAFFRKTKIDELPQLWNILVGQMSFVGPRPDMPGFADTLTGDEKEILLIKPGITGPATLKYRNEEVILAKQKDPETYNREVIWPDKVRINLAYIRNWSLTNDIKFIFRTVFK